MAILAQTEEMDTPSEDIVEASKRVFLTAANIVQTLNTIQSEGNKVRVLDNALLMALFFCPYWVDV